VKTKLFTAVLVLTIALLATPFIGTVFAQPTTVNGNIAVVSAGTSDFKFAGKSGNAIVKFEISDGWTGDINGVGSGLSTWNCHGVPMVTPGWSINIHEKLVFTTAEVQDKTGSLTMEVNLYSSEAGASGHWTILSGTDELANLHGQGTILQVAPYSYVYNGQIHFNP
jgi:hypothetical protein